LARPNGRKPNFGWAQPTLVASPRSDLDRKNQLSGILGPGFDRAAGPDAQKKRVRYRWLGAPDLNLHESQSGIEARAPKFPARSLIGRRNFLFRWIVNSPSARSKFSALSWSAGLNKVPFRENSPYFPCLTRNWRHGGAGRGSLLAARSTSHSRLRTGAILVALKLADFRRLGRDDDGAETASAEIFRPVRPTVSVGRVGRSRFSGRSGPFERREGGLRRGNLAGGAGAPMAWAMRLCAAPVTAPLSVAPDDLAAPRLSVRDRSDRADARGEVLCRFADRDRVDLEGDGKTLLLTDSTSVPSLQGLPARKRG